jgi:hypothetical protein
MTGRTVTPEERDAIALLARRGRVLAILVPDGVSSKKVKDLAAEISERLDRLAAKR